MKTVLILYLLKRARKARIAAQ